MNNPINTPVVTEGLRSFLRRKGGAAKEQKDGVCEKFLHYLSVKSIDTHTHYGRVEGVKSVRCPRWGGGGFIQSKAMNEVDAGRDRATPA